MMYYVRAFTKSTNANTLHTTRLISHTHALCPGSSSALLLGVSSPPPPPPPSSIGSSAGTAYRGHDSLVIVSNEPLRGPGGPFGLSDAGAAAGGIAPGSNGGIADAFSISRRSASCRLPIVAKPSATCNVSFSSASLRAATSSAAAPPPPPPPFPSFPLSLSSLALLSKLLGRDLRKPLLNF